MTIATRVFTLEDQQHFAALSGDVNPLHVDAAWAAAVYPGAVVVHGMHLVLWLLDAAAAGRSLAGLSVTFVRPVLLGDAVAARLSSDGTTITVVVRGEVMARIDLRFGPRPVSPEAGAAGTVPAVPRLLTLEEMEGVSGSMGLPAATPLAEAFPHAAQAAGHTALSGLAGLSALVGMECPGLYSVFAELAVEFTAAAGALRYGVSQVDRRFSRVTLAVEGGGLRGSVVASAGAPDAGEDQESIFGLVEAGEFAGQTPLVVGGGSGLGAMTARLLAAGGARPVVTVHRAAAAGTRLDVTDPAEGLAALERLGWSGGQVYYFASPRIFRRRLEPYQAQDFTDFTGIYVSGFYELMRGLLAMRGRAPLTVFYPSSVAVEKPPADMLEYALAKQAGEGLCAALERKYPSLRMVVERLPRTVSRQTRSFVKVAAAQPSAIMLPIIRRIQGPSP